MSIQLKDALINHNLFCPQKSNIQQLKEEIREKLPATNTGTLRHSHKKSRPPPPPIVAPSTNGSAVDLEIREPSELLVGVPATLTTQWRHRPHALVAGIVTYVANYLGSTVVKELRGTESTKKSIQKLKRSTREAKSTPDIVLAISYRGVQFLNTLTQTFSPSWRLPWLGQDKRLPLSSLGVLLVWGEVLSTSPPPQWSHTKLLVASTVWESWSGSIRKVPAGQLSLKALLRAIPKARLLTSYEGPNGDQATEVIMTLGQAFEVAYQMALREQFSTASPSPRGGHTRSQSANVLATPPVSTHTPVNHTRSLSVNEVKVNGQQVKEMSQTSSEEQQTMTSPLQTPKINAPIVQTEEL
uniref:PID domain-containing protein n=1 Tax=Timema douglasi TaxID=61478 RepID=A0A7R8VBJ4_TIMDO|nr:unnamed protein product [Timema douglasi]